MTPTTHKRARSRRAEYACQPLEPRTLLDGEGGDPAVTINGTAGNDLIVIERAGPNMLVTVNGTNHGVPATVLSIRVNARGGNDEIRLDSTQRDLNIFGEGGDDRLVVTQPTGRLDNLVAGDLTFDGGTGSDVVQLWDDRTPAGSNFGYVVNSGFVQRPDGASPVWSAVERVELRASGDDNLFSVRSTSSGTLLEIFGGAGDDRYHLGDVGSNLDALAGQIFINGETGGDVMRLFDTANGRGDTWSINDVSIGRPGFGGVFFNIGSAIIDAGGGNDTFNVEAAIASLSLRGGFGNDTFRLAPASQNLGGFVTTMAVDGEEGIDTLSADDRQLALANTYLVSGETIARGAGNLVNHTNVEAITLYGGTGDDSIGVPSTPIPILLEGGPGGDEYAIGNGNLEAITATVTINETADFDVNRMTVDDTAALVGHNFQLAGNTLHVSSAAPILSFTNMDGLTIRAGNISDEIAVSNPLPGMGLAINAGAGSDIIRLSGNFANVTVDGQGDPFDFLSLAPPSSPFYTLSPGFVDSGEARLVTYANVESVALADGPESNVITVTNTSASTGVALHVGGGQNLIRVLETHPTRSVTFTGATGFGTTLEANIDGVGSANLFFTNSVSFNNVGLGTGVRATMVADGQQTLSVGGTLTMGAGAVLDLANNALLNYYSGASPINTIRGLLASAYAGGTWTGPGITSSRAAAVPQHALGYAEYSEIFADPPGGGEGVTTAVYVRYTRYGDANLDRSVNLNDFNRLAGNFGQPNRHWHHGNFNYDANVNLSDFNLLAANFGMSAVPDRLTASLERARADMSRLIEELT